MLISDRQRRLNKEGIPSRAYYLTFKNEVQLVTFSRAYDGHVFRDKAGEFAFLAYHRARTWVLILTLASCVVSVGLDGSRRCVSLLHTQATSRTASVEYAPFQKVPTEKKNIDARNNMIDKGMEPLCYHCGRLYIQSTSVDR